MGADSRGTGPYPQKLADLLERPTEGMVKDQGLAPGRGHVLQRLRYEFTIDQSLKHLLHVRIESRAASLSLRSSLRRSTVCSVDMPGDAEDPGLHGTVRKIGMARSMDLKKALLKHIVCL